MNKESSHRSHELKSLGWNQDDLTRYEELWEYSQRWGLINLEREDRQFLRKAEKALPKVQLKKNSTKKSINEKSYYLWINFYLNQVENFDNDKISKDKVSVWWLLLKTELELLQKYEPVLGLPDTLKAKKLFKIRNELIEKAQIKYKAENHEFSFDFDGILKNKPDNVGSNWKSLVENDPASNNKYPIINKKNIDKLKSDIYKQIEEFMINNYPSLKDNL